MNTQSTPLTVRTRIRAGEWDGVTNGLCAGHLQANVAIVPAALADEFERVCAANSQALPLLERTRPGVADELHTAPGADLRTDLPRYHVYRDGVYDCEVSSLTGLWREDFVGFLLGCSITTEHALIEAGVRLRHLELGQTVPIFVSSIDCSPVGRFSGSLVVSMRPIAEDQVDRAVAVSGRYPLAHGAPIHVGDPSAIGITDLEVPEWGDSMELEPTEVPVFWACGVTPRTLIKRARPTIAVTHAPAHMFITDLYEDSIVGRSSLELPLNTLSNSCRD